MPGVARAPCCFRELAFVRDKSELTRTNPNAPLLVRCNLVGHVVGHCYRNGKFGDRFGF